MKKGFTLIELLAVILILGIIALIAIPTINNILKEARRGAFSSTLTNIEKAIKNECSIAQIKNKEINYTYNITDGIISPSVEIKGNLPDGTIYVDGECEVYYTLYNNNFSAVKENEETKIEDKKIYTEEILNGAVPVLSNDLIPVTIDDDGTVRKADIYSKWYSYEEKLWANAVILTDAGKIEDDDIILEDSIESYFVWIPRYKYKLFDMGNYNSYIEAIPTESNAKKIDIVFENKNNDISVGTKVGEYHSHPAFKAFDVNGLWVGKFETSAINNNLENIQIKPNKVSMILNNVNTIVDNSFNYKRISDSHLMKNTEWGSIVYLSFSKYGINGEVNINNNSDRLTGYSATPESNQTQFHGQSGNTSDLTLPYNTEVGYKASTSGNITGVYDMAGGVHEYVAAYMDGHHDYKGIEIDPKLKYGSEYFDIYPNDMEPTSYYYRILGDATGEFGPFYLYTDNNDGSRNHNSWYKDTAEFLSYDSSWISRGGHYYSGVIAGQLSFYRHRNKNTDYLAFRIVLAN